MLAEMFMQFHAPACASTSCTDAALSFRQPDKIMRSDLHPDVLSIVIYLFPFYKNMFSKTIWKYSFVVYKLLLPQK